MMVMMDRWMHWVCLKSTLIRIYAYLMCDVRQKLLKLWPWWRWLLTMMVDRNRRPSHQRRRATRPAIRGIAPRSAVAPSSQRDADKGAARVSTSAFRSFWGQSGWHKLDWLLQSNLQKLWTRNHSTQCRVKARKASRREIKYFWKRKVTQSVLPPKFLGLLVINSEDQEGSGWPILLKSGLTDPFSEYDMDWVWNKSLLP